MAIDKLVDSSKLDADITSIANAIREKNETTEQLSFPDGMVKAIKDIETGGSYIIVTSNKGVLLTCDDQTYQLLGNETKHTFTVSLGIHTVTATNKNSNMTVTDTVNVDINGIYEINLYPALLPLEYQQVEYLESTGLQYIDTEISSNSDYNVLIDFQITQYSENSWIFGEWYGSPSALIGMIYEQFWIYRNFDMDGYRLIFTETDYERHTVGWNRDGYIWDDKFNTEPKPNYELEYDVRSLYLFSRNGQLRPSYVRIFSAKFTDDENLIKKFIPCYRKSDGKTGMYDVVEGKFYTDPNGNEFIVGADV